MGSTNWIGERKPITRRSDFVPSIPIGF
jgi:hypothetical protein